MLKLPTTKFPCPVAKDCTERLSVAALSIGLIIPRSECVSGHVVRASFFFSGRHRNALTEIAKGRRRTRNRHDNVYRIVREKQGIVVYRQCALQTVTSLRVVSLVIRGHDLLKITNINPQQEARFLLWKKLDYSRDCGGNGA